MTDKTATHTPGAIRAAEAITGVSYDNRSATMPTAYGRKTTAGIAAMIDDATAAPDLLTELREATRALSEFARYSEEMQKIGRGYDFTGDRYGRRLDSLLAGCRAAIAKATGQH